jgi:DNA-binding transcriptional regulator GbsR (MarR family)
MGDLSPELKTVEDQFILAWGRMSAAWGINRTMAQIHALLLISGRPYSMDEIIERLHISRGNASMNLRDLCDWGLITRFRHPGDRKDIYQCQGDILEMIVRVIRERKRREIDPTFGVIRDCLAMVPDEQRMSPDGESIAKRLEALLEVFGLADRLYAQIFESSRAHSDVLAELQASPFVQEKDPD